MKIRTRKMNVNAFTAESRNNGLQSSVLPLPIRTPLIPIIIAMLKMAEPTIVPEPTSSFPGKKRVTKLINNSGEDVPAAMNVAPATSSES